MKAIVCGPLEPNTKGTGAHSHDFENRSRSRAGLLSFSMPGGFEQELPAIAQWFADNPPKDARPVE